MLKWLKCWTYAPPWGENLEHNHVNSLVEYFLWFWLHFARSGLLLSAFLGGSNHQDDSCLILHRGLLFSLTSQDSARSLQTQPLFWPSSRSVYASWIYYNTCTLLGLFKKLTSYFGGLRLLITPCNFRSLILSGLLRQGSKAFSMSTTLRQVQGFWSRGCAHYYFYWLFTLSGALKSFVAYRKRITFHFLPKNTDRVRFKRLHAAKRFLATTSPE